MTRLRLTLLGDFQARFGSGAPLRLRTRKTQALLAYLTLDPGQVHSRDKLAALLWGDRSQPQARSRLRETLFALRRSLAAAEPPCLALSTEALGLRADTVEVDAEAFARLARAGDAGSLARAAALYRGDFLEGVAFRGTLFEEWLMAERGRLRELALETLARLLAHQRAAGAAEDALQTALRLISLDPLQESVHRALMHLYADLGRRGAALQQYQLCVGILQSELGVEPEEKTRHLYQLILRRPPAVAAPALSRSHRPSGSWAHTVMPRVGDAPFTGRDAEMARLRSAVAESGGGQGRVVAIIGEAGVGKTRLVEELAAEVDGASRRVLLGRCHESEQILPFAPWLEVLRTARGLADEGWMASLPLAIRRELGRLLPELAVGIGDSAPSPDHLMLFDGVSQLLGHVADRQPMILILEDIHWADEMSARLLAFVGRRLQTWPLLLVVTAREEDLADAPTIHGTLAELEREPHVDPLPLRPLSRDATVGLVRALAGAGRDDAAVLQLSEAVWRTSEGSPLVVIEAMRAAACAAGVSHPEGLPLATGLAAWVLAQLGEVGAALERLREGERLAEGLAARDIVGAGGVRYHALGRACLLLGRLDEAGRLGERAVEMSRRQPGGTAHARHLLGDIATHPDRFDAARAEACYRESLALAEPRGMRPLVAHCHLGLGRLYRRLGDRERAQGHLATAGALYRDLDMSYWLGQLETG